MTRVYSAFAVWEADFLGGCGKLTFWVGMRSVQLLFVFLFSLVGLGFEVRALLAKQALYCLSNTSSPFCCSYFGDGVS
jgi:hypothetical protein